jgi:hypothetical protein
MSTTISLAWYNIKKRGKAPREVAGAASGSFNLAKFTPPAHRLTPALENAGAPPRLTRPPSPTYGVYSVRGPSQGLRVEHSVRPNPFQSDPTRHWLT